VDWNKAHFLDQEQCSELAFVKFLAGGYPSSSFWVWQVTIDCLNALLAKPGHDCSQQPGAELLCHLVGTERAVQVKPDHSRLGFSDEWLDR
jgi:hypothetical protein